MRKAFPCGRFCLIFSIFVSICHGAETHFDPFRDFRTCAEWCSWTINGTACYSWKTLRGQPLRSCNSRLLHKTLTLWIWRLLFHEAYRKFRQNSWFWCVPVHTFVTSKYCGGHHKSAAATTMMIGGHLAWGCVAAIVNGCGFSLKNVLSEKGCDNTIRVWFVQMLFCEP